MIIFVRALETDRKARLLASTCK